MPTKPQSDLEQDLKVLYTELGDQLKSDLLGSDAENILLAMLARCSHLLEQHIPVPQFNAPGETTRPRIVDVYTQLAKLLGRNTSDAVIADTIEQIRIISGQLEYPARRGRHATITPEQWIDDNVKPLLDLDQQKYIRVVRIFCGWTRLYDIWNNRAAKLRRGA